MKILSMDIEYETRYYDYLADYIEYLDLENIYHNYHQFGGVTCLDSLEIWDGLSEEATLIDGYCGDDEVISFPLTIQSTESNVRIR